MIPLSGCFWRIIFADRLGQVLTGARTPEGRLHHSGQAAFYMSPRRDWASIAIDAYVSADDPPRMLVAFQLTQARVMDLRDAQTCARLGITTATAGVPWQSERQAGNKATSWLASDAVRATDADGLIYPARSYPGRWHVVLHRWNVAGAAQLEMTGPVTPWHNPR